MQYIVTICTVVPEMHQKASFFFFFKPACQFSQLAISGQTSMYVQVPAHIRHPLRNADGATGNPEDVARWHHSLGAARPPIQARYA